MRALSINARTAEVSEREITFEANTVYSFFNSILIDELTTLKDHILYSDANALSEKKRAYFIGEQLVVGDALILGRNGFEEVDATIPKSELEALIRDDLNEFYQEVLALLASTEINLYRVFELQKGQERMELNTEWVLYTFNIADSRTQEYFINELKKVVQAEENCEFFMQKMAGLAINSVN
jgi:hypothetical protein